VLAGACSYLLNRRFTFRSERRHTQAMVWFAGVWLLCFGLNNLALGLALKLGWPFPLAALAGMVTFTVSFYALCRTWVFPRPQAPE
jgi:putative flippase GtrA